MHVIFEFDCLALFIEPLQALTLFLTHSHYLSSKHVHVMQLQALWLLF